MAVSTDEIRKTINDFALLTAFQAYTVWQNILANASTVEEVQRLSRQFLPTVLVANADQVGGYAIEQYLADRSESRFASQSVFQPQQTQILGKVNRVVNTITDFDIEKLVEEEFGKIDWADFEEQLKRESAQIAFDKYKSMMQENGASDTLVTHIQLFVRANACAFCSMVASGSSGRRRTREVRRNPLSQSGRNNERQINNRARQNALEFSADGFFAQESPAHIHDNCHCIYRPVFEGGIEYSDPVSEARLADFEKTYYEVLAGSKDLKSTDRNKIISEITKTGF